MLGSSVEKIIKAADVISEVRKAFEKIQNLESGQKALADAVGALDVRVRELEAGLREARAEIKLEAVKEAQATVNGAQGQIYQRMVDIETRLAGAREDLDKLRQIAGPDSAA